MKYSIADIYSKNAPDLRGLPYPLANKPAERVGDAKYEVGDAEEEAHEINASGSELVYPFTFFKLDGTKSYRLPNAPLVRVEGRKNIVRSKVAGRDFTVKELVSVEDWAIRIRGIAIYEGTPSTVGRQNYPFDVLGQLVELFRIGEALKVESRILEAYSISQVVVERFAVPATPGLQGAFMYEIDLSSDTDNDLIIVRNE